MSRKCTICSHSQAAKINKAIAAGKHSYRDIAKQFGVSSAATFRHTENCLNLAFGVIYEKQREKGGVDVFAEFEENLAFVRELREAARVYLADPVDPLKITIIPFADEIQVSYYDHLETTEQGKPTKKTASLAMLLQAVQDIGKMIAASDANIDGDWIMQRVLSIDKVSIKHVDLRMFALNAIDRADMCIDKFARLGGLYQKEQENRKNLENAVAAVRDYIERHPQVPKEEVLQTFAAGRQVPLEKIKTELGLIG